MRILLPMQLKYMTITILLFSFTLVLYSLYRGADTDPFLFSMLSMIVLTGSSFTLLKDEKFHRILFTMPISTKEIIKTIYVSRFIAFLYLFIVAILISIYLTSNFGNSEYIDWTITIFNTVLVMLGVSIRYHLTTDMESNVGLTFLVIFGVMFLYGIPTMMFVIVPTEEALPISILVRSFLVFALSLFIYWRMYRKSVNTITAFYIEVEEKLRNREHHS